MRAFAASLFVVLVLVGCSDAGDSAGGDTARTTTVTPTQSTVPPFTAPPAAYLEDEGGTVREGGTGTYCWRAGDLQQCVDYAGPRTNVDPIPLPPGADLEFVFEAGTPREISADWTPTDELRSSQQGDLFEWAPRDAAGYQGPSYTDSLSAPQDPGLYVLVIFTLFPEGDVAYGFYVEVRAAR